VSNYDLIIVGGGPAGTGAAITAGRARKRVLLLERGRFPRHKVCGEFISSEATGLLRELLGPAGREILSGAPQVRSSRLYLDGRILTAPISAPALSLPRLTLDDALWNVAKSVADCRQETAVETIERTPDGDFVVRSATDEWRAPHLINTSGRWSNLTRSALPPDTPRWLGVKGHFREQRPAPSVDLYFFPGGYCGVQPIGEDAVNVCAMVRADVASTLEEVLSRNRELRQRSSGWEPLMQPVSTAPLIFRDPTPVSDQGVVHAGDAAGFIDPFAGDGIAIALRSGTKAADSSAEEYSAWYRREVLPAFRAAARFRKLMETPRWLRHTALSLLGNQRVAAWAVNVTRSRT
jgi:flavin-dependent dehydrogenase